jgi:hypothetical protein
LRDRVSGREKLRIIADYFRVTGEVEKEAQTYELWTANYPRDSVPHNNLAVNYAELGNVASARQGIAAALALSRSTKIVRRLTASELIF